MKNCHLSEKSMVRYFPVVYFDVTSWTTVVGRGLTWKPTAMNLRNGTRLWPAITHRRDALGVTYPRDYRRYDPSAKTLKERRASHSKSEVMNSIVRKANTTCDFGTAFRCVTYVTRFNGETIDAANSGGDDPPKVFLAHLGERGIHRLFLKLFIWTKIKRNRCVRFTTSYWSYKTAREVLC